MTGRTSIPEHIPGLGTMGQRLKPNPILKVKELPLDGEAYFVLSRVDGHTSVREIILMSGLPIPKTIEILRRLHTLGAILGPEETPAEAATRAAQARAPRTKTGPARPEQPRDRERPPREREPAVTPATPTATVRATPTPEPSDPLGAMSAAEAAAMAEEVDLSAAEKQRILLKRRQIAAGADHCTVLEVRANASKTELKRAYRRLSKTFHPDRYYGKQIGSFAPWLSQAFQAISRAFAELTENRGP